MVCGALEGVNFEWSFNRTPVSSPKNEEKKNHRIIATLANRVDQKMLCVDIHVYFRQNALELVDD